MGSHTPPLPYTFIPTKGACAATNSFATGLPVLCEPSSWPQRPSGEQFSGRAGWGLPSRQPLRPWASAAAPWQPRWRSAHLASSASGERPWSCLPLCYTGCEKGTLQRFTCCFSHGSKRVVSIGFKIVSFHYIEAGLCGSQFSHLWNGADGGPAQVFAEEHSGQRGDFRVDLDSKLLDVSIPESPGTLRLYIWFPGGNMDGFTHGSPE